MAFVGLSLRQTVPFTTDSTLDSQLSHIEIGLVTTLESGKQALASEHFVLEAVLPTLVDACPSLKAVEACGSHLSLRQHRSASSSTVSSGRVKDSTVMALVALVT